jgi:hypothetical protein
MASHVLLLKPSAFSTPAALPGAKGPDAAKAVGEISIAPPATREIIARFTLSSSLKSPPCPEWHSKLRAR